MLLSVDNLLFNPFLIFSGKDISTRFKQFIFICLNKQTKDNLFLSQDSSWLEWGGGHVILMYGIIFWSQRMNVNIHYTLSITKICPILIFKAPTWCLGWASLKLCSLKTSGVNLLQLAHVTQRSMCRRTPWWHKTGVWERLNNRRLWELREGSMLWCDLYQILTPMYKCTSRNESQQTNLILYSFDEPVL